MNPLTNTRNITKLSQRELQYNDGKTSWHDEYKDSAWIFVGGLPYELTEGDVIAIFSQYGEIVNINCVRDKTTGKFKGFGFICYEDQRSTILAVDNFNGIKVLGRTIRVDHVKDYKPPKDSDKYDDVTRQIMSQGCAPQVSVPQEEDDGEDDLLPLPDEDVVKKKAIRAEPSSDTRSRSRDEEDRHSSKRNKKSSKSKKSKHRKEKEKKHKKEKERTKKSSKRRRSSSKSSESSSDSSDGSSDDSRRRRRKR